MRLFDNRLNSPDHDFLEIVDQTVTQVLEESGVSDLYLIEIENWFDKKWLRYAGKNLIPMWFNRVSVPPFPPARIVSQRFLSHRVGCLGSWKETEANLYPSERRPFQVRRARKIRDISDSGVFAWFSSNASANKAASLMIYVSVDGEVDVWFAGFRKTSSWYLDKVRGISRAEMERLSSLRALANTR